MAPRGVLVATGVGVLAVVGVALVTLPPPAASLVSDLAQLVASGAAAVSTARYAGRCDDPRVRRSWAIMSAACASWCAAQAYWTWMAATTTAVPFPSLADIGFLAFPALAVLALTVYPTQGGSTSRWQRAADAVMTAGAIALISWSTALGAVVADDSVHDRTTRILLLAYPVADIALVVLAVLLLSRRRGEHLSMDLLSLGVLALGVADSAFVYLAATGSYAGGVVDLGWLAGLVLIGLAGRCGAPPVRTATAVVDAAVASSSWLPYLPVAAAAVAAFAGALTGRSLRPGEQIVAVVVIAALLTRQYLALRDNTRLARDLAARELQLRHQALHDPLTGLANRALFLARLQHALDLHTRDAHELSVVFLDLDGFKAVNDELGHAAGDDLLVQIARRLTSAVRAADTVARLGGDEFAVLLDGSGDSRPGTARLQAALGPTFTVAGFDLKVRASIGVCALTASEATVSADELLARSDAAMYKAKRSGRDRAAHADAGTATVLTR